MVFVMLVEVLVLFECLIITYMDILVRLWGVNEEGKLFEIQGDKVVMANIWQNITYRAENQPLHEVLVYG